MASYLRKVLHKDDHSATSKAVAQDSEKELNEADTTREALSNETAVPQLDSNGEKAEPSQDAESGKSKDYGGVAEVETTRADSEAKDEATTTTPKEKDSTKEKDTATATEIESGDSPEQQTGEEVGSDQHYLTGTKLLLVTFGLLLAQFVVALDNTIIATAIPKITTIFDSLNDVGWYGSAYLLTTTSLQPSFGKIYAYFDVKWIYITGLLIFELGSILCAAATSSMMLIIGRAIAGCGAAALYSGSMTIIAYTVPLRQRAVYIAILSSMFGIASVVGPILGGAFTDRVSWRWCFWINLPFGAITIAVIFIFFSNPPRPYANMPVKDKIKQIDLGGAFILIACIICLLLALQWGGSVYKWSDSRVWGCLLGFGLLLMVFIASQLWQGDRATFPPHIFKGQRTVLSVALFSCFLAMALYSIIYYTPFYFQAIKNTTAEQSGIRCVPFLISITIAALFSGASVTILGPCNPVMWVGSAIFVVGAGMLYTLKPSSGPGEWIGYQIIAGAGAGASVQVPFVAVQVALSKKNMPIGNAIATFSNTLGGAISVSIAQNIFSNTLIQQIPKKAPAVDPEVVFRAGATHVRQVVSAENLPGVISAYNTAIVRTYIMAIAVGILAFFSSFIMEWRTVKGKKVQIAHAA